MDISSSDIKNFRDKYDLTQDDIAVAIGVSRELINKVERGILPISKSTNILLNKYFTSYEKENVKKIPSYESDEIEEAIPDGVLKQLVQSNRLLAQASNTYANANLKLAATIEQLSNFANESLNFKKELIELKNETLFAIKNLEPLISKPKP